MISEPIEPIRLQIWWSRLMAITDEAATALRRTAFSTIIQESNDYAVVLMDAAGRTMAECRGGVPAAASIMSGLTGHLLATFPRETWRDGDRVITNDPGIAAGHLPDIAMVSPVFHHGSLVGFTGTSVHMPDIGGTPTMGPTDLLAEGILIPPIRLFRAGRRNDAAAGLLLSNVRLPDQVQGDLEAQVAAHEVCRRKAIEFLEESGEPDFERLAATVHARTDQAIRAAISRIPDGVYTSALDADGVEGHPTRLVCTISISGDQLEVDYAGSSGQVQHAINCPLPYTRAYTRYPLKILLDPGTPRNYGSYQAITVKAPTRSIVNPAPGAPVLARHLTGHLLSCVLYQALAAGLPERVIADSGGSPALRVHFSGQKTDGRRFGLLLFASAGMGASARDDGMSTTAFPTNSGGGSIEALELSAPLLFLRKELRPDSGGAGRHRGGLGQDIDVQNITTHPVAVALLGDRERHPALGVLGGRAGAVAAARCDDGTIPSLKSVIAFPSGATLSVSFAGGGGYGPPQDRDPNAIAADLDQGFITAEAADLEYGMASRSAAKAED